MKIIWIILDSVGAGCLPDAERFGDAGADTLGHIADRFPNMQIPNLRKLGLGNIDGIHGIQPVENPIGTFGRGMEISDGKDTITGHWEMTGIYTKEPFLSFPDGFSQEVMDEFVKKTGCKGYLGNKVASGTEILVELGQEHMDTGYPIIYTSADSVFQIAASEETYGLERLYQDCEVAREILRGENQVARVIARPFIKQDGAFVRTSHRRDYAIAPSRENLLVYLSEENIPVKAIGKISDIFSGYGITSEIHTKSNMDGVDQTIAAMKEMKQGLIFTNLVEFDSMYGHRRNVEGYKEALEQFDLRLPEIMACMEEEDILILNSDHGCDPTWTGTDHTREYIPILFYGKQIRPGINFGTRKTFADIGATIAEKFGIRKLPIGESISEI